MSRTTPERIATASIATTGRYWLAEGIVWDDRSQQALWVDIHNGDLLRDLNSPVSTHLDTTVGAVALAADGGLLVAGHRGLISVSADGVVSYGPDLLGDRENVRLNDGSVDPQGRFVVGTISLTDPGTREELLRVSPDGSVEVLRTGITLSNGIGFSPDGTTIYHVDTLATTVSSSNYPLIDTWTTLPLPLSGHPDGLIVDAEGMLWVAQYGAGEVQRFSPSGELLAVATVATKEATCPGFIGPDRNTLVITTGRESATDGLAGTLFGAPLDYTGLPEHRWAGSTTAPYWIDRNENTP